jgi:TetR/AcrR family transcriptional regulator, transcriptional repressor for nem operon
MRKGEMTRQRIVALSAPVFNSKGFAGAALSDLMQATGLKKGGIYRHFANKQQLAEDAFDYAWGRAIDARFESTEEIPNTVDRLRQIILNFRDRRSGLVPGGCPMMNTAVSSEGGNPRLRAKAKRALHGMLGRLQSIIEEGKRKGDIVPSADAAKLATLIAGTVEGCMVLSRLKGSSEPLDLACEHLAKYLEDNLRNAKPAS